MDRCRFGTRALVFLVGLGLAAGCGRDGQAPDGQPSSGDATSDGTGDHRDGGPSGDVAADLALDIGTDAPVDVARDATGELPDSGPADMHPTPDLAPPDLGPDAGQDIGQDMGQDVGQEIGQDLAPDLGQPDVSQDVGPDVGQDVASDRNPDGDPNCGTPFDIHHCGTCDHDCTKLPHVNKSIESLSCQNGVCISTFCDQGYAHCSTGPGDRACETDLWSDTGNCGACGNRCGQLPGSSGVCHRGACVGECPTGRGDCTEDFGCETTLVTPDHCGACGQPACPLANVVAPCRQPGASQCNDGFCAPGTGNCDPANADCEAAYGSAAGTCLPTYKRSTWLPTGDDGVTAVRADGTRFIGGRFETMVDFDFTLGVDIRRPGDGLVYVTMAKPDGSYGWTRTFRGSGMAQITALAASADGVVIGGSFSGSIVLDPNAAAVSTTTSSGFVVKLASNGTFVWGFALETTAYPSAITFTSLVVADDGSIFGGGTFNGGFDFDPGAAVVSRIGGYDGSPFLLKLTKDRAFVWADTWEVDFTKCVFYPGRIAVSPSRVWTSGNFGGTCDFDPGAGVDTRQIGGGQGGAGYVLAVDGTGRYVGSWLFGNGVADVVADSQGGVYATGEYRDTVDFDPGTGQAVRTAVDYPSSFVVKLNAAGAFQWVTTPTRFSARAIALGGGGSVLVAGMFGADGVGGAGIVELFPDQRLGWTIGFGGPNMRVSSLATTPNGIFVGGSVFQDTDMDPGPGVDNVAGGGSGNPFISEYAF